MIIALASPRVARSLDEGLERIDWLLSEASARGARIACFPEAYLPGLRGQDLDHSIATILGTERLTDEGRQVAAVVFDARGPPNRERSGGYPPDALGLR